MLVMARHVKNQKRKRHGTSFWDHEYKNAEHLALSVNPSEDLLKFTRWIERRDKHEILNQHSSVIDVGCGNGRNILYLAQTYGMKGVGCDSSAAAIKEAKRLSADLPITYETRSMAGTYDLPDESQDLALDMMASHFLSTAERTELRDELYRMLKPGGWLFMKTFLRDGDLHTARLIKENPGAEPNAYIHPVIGVQEFAYSEEELVAFLEERFIVHKTYASHRHVSKGKARKRRTISVYAEKDPFAK
jgi:SAM-dependent methyltransferase